MSYTVQVLPEATEEIGEIFTDYERGKPGLGHRFLQALNACYQSLALSPSGQKRKGDFRHAMVHKFPYRVVYEVRGHLVVVYQVRHTSRKPHPRFGP
ncbi:MAG: type II toxin-antitoxin system RelE/ParE family toxin [Flavobacteriales bacterium]|nr:type II toxin-antitoxin system RelE/ParE family toxin [Flavobacteriales bacterium]